MPKINADFLRKVQEHCNGGLEWCEKRDIERLDLVAVSAETACIAAKEDVGLASYGVAMFKLGYEVRTAQLRPLLKLHEDGKRKATDMRGEL